MTAREAATPTIRPARADDLEALHRLIESAYRGPGGWTTEVGLVGGLRISPDELAARLGDPAALILVAERAGRPVGCAETRLDEDPAAGAAAGAEAEFGLFAVDPAAQAGGVGSALLAAHADRRRASGASALRIQVLEGRAELHEWYERRGFVRTGRRLPFPGVPELLRRPGLAMVEMRRPLARD